MPSVSSSAAMVVSAAFTGATTYPEEGASFPSILTVKPSGLALIKSRRTVVSFLGIENLVVCSPATSPSSSTVCLPRPVTVSGSGATPRSKGRISVWVSLRTSSIACE